MPSEEDPQRPEEGYHKDRPDGVLQSGDRKLLGLLVNLVVSIRPQGLFSFTLAIRICRRR